MDMDMDMDITDQGTLYLDLSCNSQQDICLLLYVLV